MVCPCAAHTARATELGPEIAAASDEAYGDGAPEEVQGALEATAALVMSISNPAAHAAPAVIAALESRHYEAHSVLAAMGADLVPFLLDTADPVRERVRRRKERDS